MTKKKSELTTWYAVYSETRHREYYYNPETGESTWILPDDAHPSPLHYLYNNTAEVDDYESHYDEDDIQSGEIDSFVPRWIHIQRKKLLRHRPDLLATFLVCLFILLAIAFAPIAKQVSLDQPLLTDFLRKFHHAKHTIIDDNLQVNDTMSTLGNQEPVEGAKETSKESVTEENNATAKEDNESLHAQRFSEKNIANTSEIDAIPDPESTVPSSTEEEGSSVTNLDGESEDDWDYTSSGDAAENNGNKDEDVLHKATNTKEGDQTVDKSLEERAKYSEGTTLESGINIPVEPSFDNLQSSKPSTSKFNEAGGENAAEAWTSSLEEEVDIVSEPEKEVGDSATQREVSELNETAEETYVAEDANNRGYTTSSDKLLHENESEEELLAEGLYGEGPPISKQRVEDFVENAPCDSDEEMLESSEHEEFHSDRDQETAKTDVAAPQIGLTESEVEPQDELKSNAGENEDAAVWDDETPKASYVASPLNAPLEREENSVQIGPPPTEAVLDMISQSTQLAAKVLEELEARIEDLGFEVAKNEHGAVLVDVVKGPERAKQQPCSSPLSRIFSKKCRPDHSLKK